VTSLGASALKDIADTRLVPKVLFLRFWPRRSLLPCQKPRCIIRLPDGHFKVISVRFEYLGIRAVRVMEDSVAERRPCIQLRMLERTGTGTPSATISQPKWKDKAVPAHV
jgi:hypothetical protein